MQHGLKILGVMLACLAGLSSAHAAPVVNKGDVAWVMTSAALVVMMAVPGLALFYGGLVRTKNMLSVLTQVFACVVLAAVMWILFGYSMAFTGGETPYVGGFSKALLAGITPDSITATFTIGAALPEYVFIIFQMAFACITPALIVGAFAERVKFSAVFLFVAGWLVLAYFPIAHMVWYWAGPDAISDAAKALAEAKGQPAIAAATEALAKVQADAGYLFGLGALDFAGGTVVHINSGIAGLVGAIMVGKRIGYGKESLAPHSLTLSMVGAALVWVGWIGFNAGSALEANGVAALAFVNTCAAAAGAALAWMLLEWVHHGKPSLLGLITGAVAGLVTITPAAGFASPATSILLGAAAAPISYLFCSTVKQALGYDDSLDVFGVHGVAGIIGALGTAIVANPAYGGAGIFDYTANGGAGAVASGYDMMAQLIIQAKAVGVTILWSGVVSIVLLFILKHTIGLRVSSDEEREGLDLASHGERAYNI